MTTTLRRPTEPAYLFELDLLRFLATVVVMLYHFSFSTPAVLGAGPTFPHLAQFTRYGYLAADLFFVISGYAILKSARHKTVRQFVVARASRLFPVYWLCCLLTFGGLWLGGSSPGQGPPTLRQLLLNLTMIPEFFGAPYLNGVCWTLTYEVAFYALVALGIAGRAWPQLPLLLGAWLGYTLLAGPQPPATYLSLVLLPKYSAFFIAGMLCYLLQARAAPAWKLHLGLLASLGLALRSARAERLVVESFFHHVVPLHLLAVLGCTALGIGLVYGLSWRRPAAAPHPLWPWLARLSYPLYLLHPLGTLPLVLLHGKLPDVVLLALAVALAIGVAWVAQVLVERPGSRALSHGLQQLLGRRPRS